MNKPFLAVLSLSMLLSACSLFPKEEEVLAPPLVEPTQVKYEVAKVELGTIVKEAKGSSTFTATEKRELSFKDPQQPLKSLLVSSGDKVKKGQVVAELELGDLEHQIEMAKYAVNKARLELKAEQQDNTYQIEAAKIEVVKAEMNAKVMETKLAKLELEKAKLQLKELEDPKKKNLLIEAAKLEVMEKEMDLAELQRKWQESRLVSPFEGEVVFVSNQAIGDKMEAYQTLVTIADPQKLFILYTAPNPEYLLEVETGMKADITLPDKSKLTGRVVQTPKNIPVNLPEQQRELYERSLLITADNLPKTVEIGTTAQIAVTIQKKENTCIIPKSALRDFSGRKYVQVLDGKSKREVDVETGIENATEVEIVKGLQEGQLVILE